MTENRRTSQVEMTEVILPQHTNSMGTAFGGTVLSWIDIAAAICAYRHCQSAVVTASVDAMHFLAPIKLGWIVNIKASINYCSNTSCEVGVKVTSEDPYSGDLFHTASAYLTLVALDALGKPRKIPPYTPITEVEQYRYKAAEERRKFRLKMRDEIKSKWENRHD